MNCVLSARVLRAGDLAGRAGARPRRRRRSRTDGLPTRSPAAPGRTPHSTPPYRTRATTPRSTRPEAALEVAPREQIAQVAEDESAGANVDAVGRAGDPHAEAADQDCQGRHDHEVTDPAQHDQPAEHDERDGIGGQVQPADVQQRRCQNAPQARHIARLDAVALERSAKGNAVDKLDTPRQQHADAQDRRLKPRGSLQPVIAVASTDGLPDFQAQAQAAANR